jgi:tol-pal system protein YbgF
MLVFWSVTTLLGCSVLREPPAEGTSRPVALELFEDRFNTQILLLNRRCEQLEVRVSQIVQEMGYLEAKLTDLVSLQETRLPGPQPVAGKTITGQAEGLPDTDSPSLFTQTPSSPDAKSLYQAAYACYRAGDYTRAIVEFQDFLDAYPSDGLADNARYWIGESYYAQGNFEAAITNFIQVIEAYPEGNKVPDALLKLGYAYIHLNENQKAREYLQKVTDQYPSSEGATKARVRLEKLLSESVANPPTKSSPHGSGIKKPDKEPAPLLVSEEVLARYVADRMSQLDRKRNLTQAQTVELNFIRKNGDNPEALAGFYGMEIKESPGKTRPRSGALGDPSWN